ncbi:c-type cytochrome [Microvirga sp. SRT01]|jgi:mono/diheme cytochrome c family protein|uniref:C-type cytochrome n=1 Tax=Sphingomonas longa TaxID=2778730 RepID=A0ABS2D8M0_9SPHN|nr:MULTISPECIES: c-type cytochrome [Alphaproteobacteria]MBM6577265.1 c-type cytochrome [Sphingomonas sp. BT552]MBR7710309.1 c-type cytochrome [Microvirga sp. SRT01]
MTMIDKTRGLWLLAAATTMFGAAVVANAQASERSVWSGVYTAEQATRGKAAYAANCAACHGDSLSGIDVAPALTGSGFLNNWNNTSAGDLLGRIQTTMPLNAPGSLSGKTVADIEAYIFQSNGFPAGELALPPSQPMAAGIKIGAKPAG